MDGKTLMIKYNYSEKVLIYGLLIIWAFICLFPIFWTVTTTFKIAPNVQKGDILPWIDFVDLLECLLIQFSMNQQ